MRKRLRLTLIIVSIVTLVGIRVFSPEDTRICDGNKVIKHGNPSADGSGFFCSWGKLFTQSSLLIQRTPMKIITDFIDNGKIPSVYTCDGEGRFPDINIDGIPTGSKSLVLIVDDPDAPMGVRSHILLANIPVSEFDNLTISQDTFDLWIFGQNGRWEQSRWAPCPPSGTHRYIFKVYALSEMLELSSWFSKERLVELMWGKILAQTQIVGVYTRQ